MPSRPIVLVADDRGLARPIQDYLDRVTGPPVRACAVEDVHDDDLDGGSLLLLTVATAAEAARLQPLVQTLSIREHLSEALVIEADTQPRTAVGLRTGGHSLRQLRWPDDAADLTEWLRSHRRQGGPPVAADEDIARQLWALTPSLLPLADHLAVAAAHDVTVLLTGETGTGKTHLARMVHRHSPRRDGPFVPVACGALPANLVASAFFGHVKGAFTGADRSQEGRFAAADGGTILLDEIDALSPEHQAALLRVIETGEYEPVGGNETRRTHARVIAASNWDLEEAVARGRFRQDLYYRLHVMAFHLPPLRERPGDVARLARAFVAHFTRKFHKGLYRVGAQALAALAKFPWPGNVRQLENVLQQAVLLSRGPELLVNDLPEAVRHGFNEASPPSPPEGRTLTHSRDSLERKLIQKTLKECGYRRGEAAKVLGISRVALWKKMKKTRARRAMLLPHLAVG
jgi:DNA-binding NtrC family response regulator